ncbi:MAG: hypothetical protein IT361_00500 [Gemmatimonadaceae bacterium]|nr:hypothetical protein [Gemmatimonadaceae bacterium]
MGPEFLVPIAFFFAAASVVRTVLRHKERRLELETQGLPGSSRDAAMRLERMEQAIDAMAVEIERIAEAQRFTTRLLAERAEQGHHLPTSEPRR